MTQLTYLYRHFDKQNRLLYVGITSHIDTRTSTHRAKSPWGPEIARTLVETFDTRIRAAIAELQAIEAEKPLHNIVPGRERRRKMESTVMLSARIPTDLAARMKTLCDKEDLNVSDFVREVLEKALPQKEAL